MHFRRRPWLTLLACLAAAGGSSAQVLSPQDAAPARAAPSAPAAPAETPASGLGLSWRGAPIVTSGSVSYDLRTVRGQDLPSTLSQLVTTSLNARSYIYQPWFATVQGTLGLTTGSTRNAGGADTVAQGPFASQQERFVSKDRFVTGSGRVDLFPRSRFPFEFHVERSDSRIDSGLASTFDFRRQSFGFSQRYQPVSRAYRLSASFDRHEQVGAAYRDTQNQLVGDFDTKWKHNELALGASHSQAARPTSDERSQFTSLVARHQYTPGSALSVNTTVNWTRTDEQLAALASDLSVLQLSSVGLWRQEGSKLALNGSVRGLLLRDAAADTALNSFGLTLGASYELNKNARLTAVGSANATDSNGMGSQSFSGSAVASWQGDTLEFKGLQYDWFASGSAGGSTSSGSGHGSESQTTLGLQLGHTLSRAWRITSQSGLVLNAGQTVSTNVNRSSLHGPGDAPETLRTLMHTAGATFNITGDNRSAYARASINDSKELGGTHARFQMFNFQLSGNFEIDRNRSLVGDLTLQRAKQRPGDRFDAGAQELAPGERTSSSSASGEVTYRQQRLFGIPRLRFTSRVKLAQDVLKEPGTLSTFPDRETRLWENRLDWIVGRLESQLIFRIAEVDGKRRNFLMWRVQRSFGD